MMTCTNLREIETLNPEERLVPAVRRALQMLPLFDRQLIALHFGGGLSHVQIANALALPCNFIHQRLRASVTSLRACVSREGVAEPVSDDCVGRAVTSGIPVPGGLYEKVQQRISAALHATGNLRREIDLASRFAILLTVYLGAIRQH
jgi:hypothetical protein